MRGLDIAGLFVITLLCGFANQLAIPHELVPVDTAALVACVACLKKSHWAAKHRPAPVLILRRTSFKKRSE